MKILFIHPSVELYGADKILLYIVESFCKSNEITLLFPKQGILIDKIRNISSSIKIIVDENLPIVHSKLKIKDFVLLPFRLSKFSKKFSKNEFDIVYCNTLATVLLLYTNWAKKKVIHVHEIIMNKVLNFGFSFLIRIKTKNVICVSEHVKENLYFSRKYKVIHNGIPDDAKDITPNIISDKIVFSLPGRIMPQKGQWFVLNALELLAEEYINRIEIRMYGSPPPYRKFLLDELKKKIANNVNGKIVKLFDFETDISGIYKNANVILVPSIMADPFPTTVLEALEFARPVISTNHGGASEILDDSCSVLVNKNNVDELVNAIIFFVDNVSRLNEFSRNARKKFEQDFKVDTFKVKLFKYLNEITGKHK